MAYKSLKLKETKENIEMFDGYKIIARLAKPRSSVSVLFCTNDLPDEWLINLIEYKTKSGTISHRCMILSVDLERKYEIYKKEGFITKV